MVHGIDRLTTGQLTKLTAKLKRPHSLFFRPSVPPSAPLPPELRTAAGRGPRRLFPNERLEIRRARRVQRFVAALSERDVPPSIPSHEIGASPNAIAGCPVVVPGLALVALRRHDGVPIERGGEAAGDGVLVRRGPSAGRARPRLDRGVRAVRDRPCGGCLAGREHERQRVTGEQVQIGQPDVAALHRQQRCDPLVLGLGQFMGVRSPRRRPHASLGGLPPASRVPHLRGLHT